MARLDNVCGALQATHSETVQMPPKDPNPLLANLKPGLAISGLVPHLRYYMDKYTWEPTICNQLTPQQQGSFFCSDLDGCQRFMDHLVSTEDRALQYAALEIFKK